MTLSKSWKITIIVFAIAVALPLVNEHLPEENQITQDTVNHFLALFLGTGAIGAANSAKSLLKSGKISEDGIADKIANKQKVDLMDVTKKIISAIPATAKHVTSGVSFTQANSWIQTNFRKDAQKGNVIDFGQSYLWIKVPGARSYVTAILKNYSMQAIQIDQSSQHDEDNDITTTRLELFQKNGDPLPRGVYYLTATADAGSGDSQGIKDDKFEIV